MCKRKFYLCLAETSMPLLVVHTAVHARERILDIILVVDLSTPSTTSLYNVSCDMIYTEMAAVIFMGKRVAGCGSPPTEIGRKTSSINRATLLTGALWVASGWSKYEMLSPCRMNIGSAGARRDGGEVVGEHA